jgi:hypothetical protein
MTDRSPVPARLDGTTLPADCVRALRVYLRAPEIAVEHTREGARAHLLGATSTVHALGAAPDSSLVIVAGRPVDRAPWGLGDCFPHLPGAWDGSDAFPRFRLRHVGLADALWMFVWGDHIERDQVHDALLGADWLDEWLGGQDLDGLGFDTRELRADPTATWATDDGGSGFMARTRGAPTWRAGLFLWGDVVPGTTVQLTNQPGRGQPGRGPGGVVSAATGGLVQSRHRADVLALLGELGQFLKRDLNFVKARLEHELGFPHLVVQLPASSGRFGDDDFAFENAAAYFSSPVYYSPDDARVGVRGDFVFSGDKRIHLELEYPLDGDRILATGKYLGGPEHFLGDSASFGLPGTAPTYGADEEIELDLEFSKSARSLIRLSFSIELREKHWPLLPAPVKLALAGVSFHVTVFDPLGESRAIMADIAAEAEFGDDPFRLLCGGSYPSGLLFLQSRTPLEVGTLIEKLVGPCDELDTLTIDDLRIEYNYRVGHFALEMDVAGPWPIVEGFDIEDIRFRVQGGESYTGGLSARIEIPGVEGKPPVVVQLSALYAEGWQLEGRTGAEQSIPIGHLVGWLAGQFDVDAELPDALRDPDSPDGVALKNLALYANTASKEFSFTGEVDFHVDGRAVMLVVSIDVTCARTDENGVELPAEKRFGGVIKVGDHAFDVVFAGGGIARAGSTQPASIHNLVASYHSVSGTGGPKLSQLVPASWTVPDVEMLAAFIARQKQDEEKKARWLFGVKLKAGLQLGDIKLPSLPLIARAPGLTPETSLSIDFQAVGASGGPFSAEQIQSIGALDATGSLSLPATGIEKVAIVALVTMNGKVVSLDLPVKPGPRAGGPAIVHDPDSSGIAPMTGTVPRDAPAPADGTQWVNVQKRIGPVEIARLGLRYDRGRLYVLLDAALGMGGLTVSLAGLGADSPLDHFDPDFHLSGIGVDYRSPSVAVGASLLKQEMIDPGAPPDEAAYTAYFGQAVLRTEELSLSAIGAYARYRREPSLFIYALLDATLGGPPFFFVTGMALGFGYNRAARIPRVDQVHAYPLVSRAIAGPRWASRRRGVVPRVMSATDERRLMMDQLKALDTWIPPEVGQTFLAVGVKFTTFKLIDSFALLIAQFGEHDRFDLVGVSHLQVPGKEAGSVATPLAEVFMDWKAFFHPAEGELGLKATLVPGSYVFSRDCHLSGDFAYYAWFSGEHAGDFVYTLGGYHPKFEKPPHYPVVNRLQCNWILRRGVDFHLKGTFYYAVCGHALMAGGGLDASLSGGFDIGIAGVDFRASLHIAADFLISWEPYHYDASVELALALELSAHLLFYSWHGSLDVRADMHLWGPEFSGEAHVYLKVWKIRHALDYTFGDAKPHLVPITWARFQQAFLPQLNDKVGSKSDDKSRDRTGGKTDPHGVCGVSVKGGLIRTVGDGDTSRWVVNPMEFALTTNSLIPIKQGTLGAQCLVSNDTIPTRHERPDGNLEPETITLHPGTLGIASMGVAAADLETTFQIHIDRVIHVNREGEPADSYFRCKPILKSMPTSLWGVPRFENTEAPHLKPPAESTEGPYLKPPELDGAQTVPGVLAGFQVLPATPARRAELFPVDRNQLKYETELRGLAQFGEDAPRAPHRRGKRISARQLAQVERIAWNPIASFEPLTAPRKKKNGTPEQPWETIERTLVASSGRRDAILEAMGLGRETIRLRHKASDGVLDAPLIEREALT